MVGAMGACADQQVESGATIKIAGINPYVDVPQPVSDILSRRRNISVVGTIDGKTFRSTFVPLGGGRHRLYVNGAMRQAAGVGVGDRIAISARYDLEPREQPVPPELLAALEADPAAQAEWEAWTPSRRKDVLVYLNWLKKPVTVQRNVEKVLRQLHGDA
ncbi:MAG: hypothetical protein CL878_02085 [Dehalococcoidia bacterium]|nr:hypothetical protein [Dehalococcoidia bacterium]